MSKFIKVTFLEDDGEEPALVPIREIYQIRKTKKGVQLWWYDKDDQGDHYFSYIKEQASEISKMLESQNLIFHLE